jgi:beta-lactamase superfamily II metal-dependent hydrolase
MAEMKNPKKGDTVWAGYPTAFVYNYKRNKKTKVLGLSKVKHLLWGDWVQVTDYSYATDASADLKSAAEKTFTGQVPDGMVPVRVRGESGYMYIEDLRPDQLCEIVFCDVGQGDGALLITPDDKKFVVDAGVGDNMYRYLRWRFAGFKGETDFDGFIVTHPDQDHYFGFTHLIDDDRVKANTIWHNGLVEQFGVNAAGDQSTSSTKLLGSTKVVQGQKYLNGLIESDKALRDFLKTKARWIKKSTGKPKQFPGMLNDAVQAKKSGKRRFPKIEMLSDQHGEIHAEGSFLPSFGPDNKDGCSIQILGPVVEVVDGDLALRTFGSKPMEKTTQLNTGKTKNGHSVLLKMQYGAVSILFGGDLNSTAEMFLLGHYTGLPVYDPTQVRTDEVVEAAKPIFRVDVSKACHHGSADFTDHFLETVNASATVISSGDKESHAHPRSDTLGALGHHGRGSRSLIFSTELSRSTDEFTKREDSPWFQAHELDLKARLETDAALKRELKQAADEKFERAKKRNVTVYGAINLRTDGDKVVLAYMLEKPSKTRRWDVYTLESVNGGALRYKPVKQAEEDEKKRREGQGA